MPKSLYALALALASVPILLGCGLIGGGEDEPEEFLDDTSDDVIYMDDIPAAPLLANDPESEGRTSLQGDTDYDTDEDGLIEIKYLEHLHALRYDLDGDGFPSDEMAYWSSFTGGFPGMGCPDNKCRGYEIVSDLDFLSSESYQDGSVVHEWIDPVQRGWSPIGDSLEAYTAVFEGNSHRINGLYLRQTKISSSGLFGSLAGRSHIQNLSLTGVRIEGLDQTGSLAGENSGRITNTHAEGSITGHKDVGGLVGKNSSQGVIDNAGFEGRVWGWTRVGGLVGYNEDGLIRVCYFSGEITGLEDVGGLVGSNELYGSVDFAYAEAALNAGQTGGGLIGRNRGRVQLVYSDGILRGKNLLGGLIGYNDQGHVEFAIARPRYGERNQDLSGAVFGFNSGLVSNTLWDTRLADGMAGAAEGDSAGLSGYDTETLTRPDSYSGLYERWNIDVNGDTRPDSPWDMGDWVQYPLLNPDLKRDGEPDFRNFGNQSDMRQ